MYTRLPVWSIVLHTSDAVSTATAVGRLRLGLSSSLAGHSTMLKIHAAFHSSRRGSRLIIYVYLVYRLQSWLLTWIARLDPSCLAVKCLKLPLNQDASACIDQVPALPLTSVWDVDYMARHASTGSRWLLLLLATPPCVSTWLLVKAKAPSLADPSNLVFQVNEMGRNQGTCVDYVNLPTSLAKCYEGQMCLVMAWVHDTWRCLHS